MNKGIIDRFEGNYALVEVTNGIIKIEKESLPPEAREGDVISIEEEGIIVDIEETNKRREKLKRLMDELYK